jgi:hypothetical protein
MPDAKAEMESLWSAVFGGPPAIDADPGLLAALILRCSGPPPVYRMEAAKLRLPGATDSTIVDACPSSKTTPVSVSPDV